MVHPEIPRGKKIRASNPNTIQDKFLVGYQGKFTCPAPDGTGSQQWTHWFTSLSAPDSRPEIDLWPDTSEYSPSELCLVPSFSTSNGDQCYLFNSQTEDTIRRHIKWMAVHGVDGCILQRTASDSDRDIRDKMLRIVIEACEKEGRVFAIQYDASGIPSNQVVRFIEQDWQHLMRELGILESRQYLREHGCPVIGLRGFGFTRGRHAPRVLQDLVRHLRRATPSGAYLLAEVPAHWRTGDSDADSNPAFLDLWLKEVDMISPRIVGSYTDERDIESFSEVIQNPDVELLNRQHERGGKKVDYMPMVIPGRSAFNHTEGRLGWNDIKRDGGRFLWKQVWNAARLKGVRSVFGATWDGYEMGTAFLPVVSTKRMLPTDGRFNFMALDEDGHDLPSDWYMRICAFAADGIRSERLIHESFPSKELQDYWSTHPRYEDGNTEELESERTKREADERYNEWLKTQGNAGDSGEAPPPYSLEADEETPAQTVPQTATQTNAAPDVNTLTSQMQHASVSAAEPSASSVASSSSVPLQPATISSSPGPSRPSPSLSPRFNSPGPGATTYESYSPTPPVHQQQLPSSAPPRQTAFSQSSSYPGMVVPPQPQSSPPFVSSYGPQSNSYTSGTLALPHPAIHESSLYRTQSQNAHPSAMTPGRSSLPASPSMSSYPGMIPADDSSGRHPSPGPSRSPIHPGMVYSPPPGPGSPRPHQSPSPRPVPPPPTHPSLRPRPTSNPNYSSSTYEQPQSNAQGYQPAYISSSPSQWPPADWQDASSAPSTSASYESHHPSSSRPYDPPSPHQPYTGGPSPGPSTPSGGFAFPVAAVPTPPAQSTYSQSTFVGGFPSPMPSGYDQGSSSYAIYGQEGSTYSAPTHGGSSYTPSAQGGSTYFPSTSGGSTYLPPTPEVSTYSPPVHGGSTYTLPAQGGSGYAPPSQGGSGYAGMSSYQQQAPPTLHSRPSSSYLPPPPPPRHHTTSRPTPPPPAALQPRVRTQSSWDVPDVVGRKNKEKIDKLVDSGSKLFGKFR